MKMMDHKDWIAEGKKRFGDDHMQWKFVCPSCGYIASLKEWEDAGAPEGAVAFSCIGRFTGSKKTIGDKTGGPCNYTGGGLFQLNPVCVTDTDGCVHRIFDFAEVPASEVPA